MTLEQLAGDYRAAGDRLRARLRVLRRAERLSREEQERFWLRRRIAAMTTALTQINELTELLERYYEKGYYRNERSRL